MQDAPSFQGGALAGNGSMPTSDRRLGRLGRFADAAARWTIYVAIVLIPLLYLPFTSETLEFNKQSALVVITIVTTIAWLGKMLANRKVEFRRSMMNLLVGVYLVIYLLTAWFSKSRYVSFVGDFGQEQHGVVTVVCFVLLYFAATNVLRGAKDVKNVLDLAMLGGLLVLVHAYLQALGVRLFPGTAASAAGFNLIGTSNGLGIYAGAMLALVMGSMLMPEEGKLKTVRRILMGILGVLALFYIASLSFWALWAVVVASAAVLVAYGMIKTQYVKRVTMLAIPMAVIVIGILFSFLRFPISLGLPAEVMPSMKASWNIARESLASRPIFGSGPGTFLYDYAQFRSKDLNSTSFWSVGFDRAASQLLTVLATTGILGLAALLVFALYLGVGTGLRLATAGGGEKWLLTLATFSGWTALLVGKIVYSSDLTLEFLFWILTALLVILASESRIESKFKNSPRAALSLSFLFIVAIIFSIAGLYLAGQRYVAEAHYAAAAQRRLNKPEDVDASINDLVRSTQLNGQNDLYMRTLSQALALKTNLQIQKAGAKPTADDTRQIAVLAANAVNAGKAATDLDPANVQNWSSLASLYSDLATSVPGAADAAEKAYAQAIQLEPNNPVYYTSLGQVYLALADAARQALQGAKDQQKADLQKLVDDNLAKAQDNFEKSIDLKQDYAPAHYWLALTFQRQGKLREAVAKLEAVRALNPNDLGVGFQLAILYYQSGAKDKAITELERVVALSPQYSNARWYLAAMYEDAGRIDDAIAQIQEVLKYNKDNPDVQKRLADLEAKKSGQPAPPSSGLPAPVQPPPQGQVIPPKQ